MEHIQEDSNTVTIRFTRAESTILYSILRVLAHDVEDKKVDYEELMVEKEDVRKFLADFDPTLETEV